MWYALDLLQTFSSRCCVHSRLISSWIFFVHVLPGYTGYVSHGCVHFTQFSDWNGLSLPILNQLPPPMHLVRSTKMGTGFNLVRVWKLTTSQLSNIQNSNAILNCSSPFLHVWALQLEFLINGWNGRGEETRTSTVWKFVSCCCTHIWY